MKIAVIEVYPNKVMNKANAIDAHLRNSIILSEYLNADLLCIEDDFMKALKKKYDVLLLGYASGYAPFKLIRKLIENNPDAVKFVFSNEYNIVPSLGGFRPFHMIAGYETCNNVSDKSLLSFHHVNVNLLLAGEPNKRNIQKKYDCIYYGTFRENRKIYFKKYLQQNIYLSTSDKNFKKFKHIGCNPKLIKKLSWKKNAETLNLFKYSLYIEDDYSNNNFTNLANRYYEAQKCNCISFFDSSCLNTILKSELLPFADEVKQYFVNSHAELTDKIKECNKNFEKHLAIQQNWLQDIKQRRLNVLKEIKEIIYKTTEKHKNIEKP